MAVGTTTGVTNTQATRPTSGPSRAGRTGSPAQFAAARADQVLGQNVSPAQAGAAMHASGPVGSDAVRNAMLGAGMQNVSQPPSEAELRTYYSQHAAHHDLISQGHYSDAAAQYRADAQRLPENDPQRRGLESTATQLDYANHMREAAAGRHGTVSFPPSNDEVKAHFRGLRSQSNNAVAGEFRNYTSAYYSHVNSDPEGSRSGDLEYSPHNVRRGNTTYTGMTTPSSVADVSDRRQLNSGGQRLVDCEGYAFLGNQLMGEAGFRQPSEGGVHVVKAANAEGGHVMVEMQRNGESVFISNNHAYQGDGAPSQAYGDYMRAVRQGGTGVRVADLQDYYGSSEDAALIARERHDRSHQTTFQVGH